ncbi:bifunctional tryptophan synthase trp1 [Naganishia vaughanmartiniae]|uniref:Bifunctional tryptophan synthase trp1 n=1 Tax=Naganishia vaughanmartiniae TaxID=1424756 RepID=A0ACC2XRN1_9TREE|nr:bifunctional tryptophan synthase trp1 [Naganishia vaughanmartiniae]
MSYGEEKAVQDARDAGANGFIMVDLPPEEAIKFREICTSTGISYVPLIAPSTSIGRVKFLAGIADSFIYVVSKMGTTGSTREAEMNTGLPEIIARIRAFTPVPLAVGFGVSTRVHFEAVTASGADAVVIGSRIIDVIREAPQGQAPSALEAYCREITLKGQPKPDGPTKKPVPMAVETNGNGHANGHANGHSAPHVEPALPIPPADPLSDINPSDQAKIEAGTVLPARFGAFGGQYVAEALVDSLSELEEAHKAALADPAFWKEFEGMYTYMNRPSNLYEAERLTEYAGGAKIWMKLEPHRFPQDQQRYWPGKSVLLARRLGKTKIIAETGAGQHGVATATACARFGLECVVYMGAEDVRRQALNVFRINMLGAKVIPVTSGSQTLKDAVNEAMRAWVSNLSDTHYCVGSAIGPHPFPTIVRDYQRVIGREIKQQLFEKTGKLPDAVVACVGGGSNAIGTFYDFIKDEGVRLVGVEAGGDGVETARHSATLSLGTPGVLHGVRTYLLQSKTGQIMETHSISAGLDYPGVGPEHAWLKDSGRAEYIVATDEEALRGFRILTQKEGIIPALESAHAVWGTIQLAKTLPKEANIVMCLSGRGDKDVEQISQMLPKWADKLDWHIALPK